MLSLPRMLWLSVGPGPVDMVPPTLSFSLGGVTGSPTASLCVLLSSSETSWRGGGVSSLESLSRGSGHSISQPALCVETENKSATLHLFLSIDRSEEAAKGASNRSLMKFKE